MAMKHSVYDTDTHFSISPITRVLKNEASAKTTLIQYDHNSERFTFEMPRHIEGHDMSLCDLVQVHYNNIDAVTKEQSQGVYDVEDLQISPDSDDVVIMSWLISGNATKFVGSLNFLVRFACLSDNATLSYVWNTAIYTAISVSSGIYNGEAVIEEYTEILEEWKQSIIAEVETAKNEAIEEVSTYKPTYTAKDVGARPDTWVPTLTEIGAAPAGFGGFGEPLSMYEVKTNDDLDGTKFESVIESLLSTMKDFTSVQIRFGDYPHVGGTTYIGTLFNNTAGYAVLLGYTYGNQIVMKTKSNGVWKPFEWVNPNLMVGKEYRTTERMNGKAIYKKNDNGVIKYRLDGETEWKDYASIGAKTETWTFTLEDGSTIDKVVYVR